MREKDAIFKKGEKAAKFSAVIILAMSISKSLLAIASGSVALFADSVHSFADIFSSIAVWAGLRLVQKRPTERFPYGYYKAETFALLTVAITIGVSGALILIEAVDKLFAPGAVLFPSVVLAVAAASGLVNYVLGKYKKNVGISIGSQSLVGEGQHSMVDVYTSLIVFVSVSFSSLGYPMAEALAGIAIGLYVIRVGLWSGKDAALVLMDASLSPQRAREIKEIALSVRGVTDVHSFKLRKSGPVSFGEMHIEVPEDLPLERAHFISDETEKKIKQRFRDIESITIHLGPAHKERIKVGIPISEDRGMVSTTSTHFGNVPFFAFAEIEGREVRKFYVKPNNAIGLTRKKGIETARFLMDEEVDVVLAVGIGEGPFHLLKGNMVKTYVLPQDVEVKEAIRLISENKLEIMITPTEKQGER